jgi:hypothetical protein
MLSEETLQYIMCVQLYYSALVSGLFREILNHAYGKTGTMWKS